MEEVQVNTGTKRPYPGGEGGGPGFGKRGSGFNSQFGGRGWGGAGGGFRVLTAVVARSVEHLK